MTACGKAAPTALLSLVCLLGACIPEYRAPTLGEPHAVVKVRRTYDTIGGTKLYELLLVDDHGALSAEVPSELASAPRIDPILVHPIPARFTPAASITSSGERCENRTSSKSRTPNTKATIAAAATARKPFTGAVREGQPATARSLATGG